MDQARRDFWAHYVRMLANRMELRDWTVGIATVFCEDGANASVNRTRGRKIAMIALKVGWDDIHSPEEQRQTLVHELIHCHLIGSDLLLADARENLGKSWISALEQSVGVQQEYAIDALAAVIAPFMPLPGEYDDEEPGNAGPRSKPIKPPKKKRKKKAMVA